VQKVERATNRSYYLNLPVVLAEAMEITKGEEMKWLVEDKNVHLRCSLARGRTTKSFVSFVSLVWKMRLHPLYHNEAVGYSAWPDHQFS
jgi:hypothetical protein